MDRPPKDPGWQLTPGVIARLLVPGAMQRLAAQGKWHALVVTRFLFASFVNGLVLIGLLVVLFVPGVGAPEGGDRSLWIAAIVVVGIGATLFGFLFRPGLDCSSDPALTSSFRTRMFLRIASAEAVALLGFVGALVTSTWWLYFLGLAFAAVGMFHAAPSARNLRNDQRKLVRSGCQRWIVAAFAAERRPGSPPT